MQANPKPSACVSVQIWYDRGRREEKKRVCALRHWTKHDSCPPIMNYSATYTTTLSLLYSSLLPFMCSRERGGGEREEPCPSRCYIFMYFTFTYTQMCVHGPSFVQKTFFMFKQQRVVWTVFLLTYFIQKSFSSMHPLFLLPSQCPLEDHPF